MESDGPMQYHVLEPASSAAAVVDASPSSANSSEMFMYEDSSMSDGSLYASDQEIHSVPIKRSECRKLRMRRSRSPQHQIQQRQAANLRERRRMRSINDAFEGLRAHIPTLPYEKRLSKVDTLKLAISYISFLGDLVRADKNSSDSMLSGRGNIQNKDRTNEPQKVIMIGSNSQTHSLSWSRLDERPRSSTLRAKIWVPEDPRPLKKKGSNIIVKEELR